jgi:Flp pilus assembly protein protease CpaA
MGLSLMDVVFPNPAFGWVFLLAILSVLIAACYFDFRRRIIPNRLTIPALLAGFAINALRLGMYRDHTPSGVMEGLLFSLLGFLLGFGLFLIFWLIGLCQGGDVKLFAAVASWLGWRCSFWVWLLSFMIMSVLMVILVLARSFAGASKNDQQDSAQPAASGPKRGKRVPYSIALTVAVAIVLLWLQARG